MARYLLLLLGSAMLLGSASAFVTPTTRVRCSVPVRWAGQCGWRSRWSGRRNARREEARPQAGERRRAQAGAPAVEPGKGLPRALASAIASRRSAERDGPKEEGGAQADACEGWVWMMSYRHAKGTNVNYTA